MDIGSLFSGGKDSTFALYKSIQEGHRVKTLITISSQNVESYMFHVPNIWVTQLHSQALGIPIILRETKGIKETELQDLKIAIEDAIRIYHIEGIVSGAIFSNYQRSRIDSICDELGIKHLTPLWKKRPKDMLIEIVSQGFKIIMSGVSAGGLGQRWLGREIDCIAIQDLCKLYNGWDIGIGGEGGEFETLVLDAPFFKKKIVIIDAEKEWGGQSGVYNVKKAVLVEK